MNKLKDIQTRRQHRHRQRDDQDSYFGINIAIGWLHNNHSNKC